MESRQLQEFQALSPERQLTRLERLLTFAKVMPLLSPTDRDRLRTALLAGQVDVTDLVRLVTREMGQDPARKADILRNLLPE
ncbi:hypothetical protein GCM10010842_29840 [Deinococcus daejeonensis]|uniref:Uncharacterized protein n=1 Tax=Deinococcus daejeonensis TaxID=1007098 RepID=A0ABQ2JD73_9DEIO|nr:hypothetical protein GCM10010842_29840 [Deinococcus daejeonensis]